MLDFYPLSPAGKADACVIWLHGLGADGHDFVPMVPELKLGSTHNVQFIFPHAPSIPVTLNGGMVMPAWYDILTPGLNEGVDVEGIERSTQAVLALMADQHAQGIAYERMVLAGFSQGGVIALNAMLQSPQPLAGAMGLSTYLPVTSTVEAGLAARQAPLPIFMAHGTLDSLVTLSRGEAAQHTLSQAGFDVDWHTYPMAHQVCAEEIDAIAHWLKGVLHVTAG